MASFSAGTTFTDGVANDVTAAKLEALVNAATPTSGLIQDRTAETTIDVNDTLLVGDASDSNNLKRMTVANFAGTLPTATITSGTVTNLASTTGTIATLNSTTGTIATLNSTTGTIATGVIPTLTSTTLITTGTGTAASPAIVPTGDSNTGIFFPAADTIALSEGGAESMRIDSSGQVGIGTTSPATKFHVASGNMRLDDNQYILWGGTTNGINGNNASNLLGFYTNSAEALRIDSSGQVGIGTTSPATKLHVLTANPTSENEVARFQGGTNASNFRNYISLYTTNPAYWWELSNQDVNGGGSTNGLAFRERSNTASVERVYIAQGGNVGIGISSPTSPLHVYNSANSGKLINIANPNAGTGAYAGFDALSDTVSLSVRPYGSTFNTFAHAGIALAGAAEIWADTISGSGPQALLIGIKTAKPLIFATSETERVRIDSSGQVGIGVTAPVNKLEVVGSFGRGAPVTKTTNFSLADTENWLIVNKGSSCTVTLPAASSWTGREFTIKVITAHTVVSASSNIIPRIGGSATTAILPATDGAWATLVSNGTNWEIMCGR